MISDPKTAPDHRTARIIWGALVGAISFYLTAFEFINASPVWVLVLTAPLVPVLDDIFKAKAFEWTHSKFSQDGEHLVNSHAWVGNESDNSPQLLISK